jgi:hypothetical protein
MENWQRFPFFAQEYAKPHLTNNQNVPDGASIMRAERETGVLRAAGQLLVIQVLNKFT